MATTTQLLTYEDLCRMPDDGNRYEIIAGELVVSPAPTWLHQAALFNLGNEVRSFVDAGDLGWVGIAPLDIRLARHDIVQPDLVFVSQERASILVANGTEGAPDLVVEVLSPSTRRRDLGSKLSLYASAGIREYWALDLFEPAFLQYVSRDGQFELVPNDGQTVRSATLLGLEIDLVQLFSGLGKYAIGNR